MQQNYYDSAEIRKLQYLQVLQPWSSQEFVLGHGDGRMDPALPLAVPLKFGTVHTTSSMNCCHSHLTLNTTSGKGATT